MKKISITLAVIFFVTVSVAGIVYWYRQSKQPTSISDCTLIVPNEANPFDQGLYFTGCDFVWECEQLSKQNIRDVCLSKLAKKNNDQGICKKIKNEAQKKWCENFFEARLE